MLKVLYYKPNPEECVEGVYKPNPEQHVEPNPEEYIEGVVVVNSGVLWVVNSSGL